MGSQTAKWTITQDIMAHYPELQRLIPNWKKMGRPRLYIELQAQGWRWSVRHQTWIGPKLNNMQQVDILKSEAQRRGSKPDKIMMRLIMRRDRVGQVVAEFVELAEVFNYKLVKKSGNYESNGGNDYVRVYLTFRCGS